MGLRVVVLDRDVRYGSHAEEALVGAGHVVLGRFEDAEAALALLAREPADAVVVDPTPWGAALIERLRLACPDAKPLVVAEMPSLELVTECIEAGAQGFVSKRTSAARLADLVVEAVRGEAPVSQDAGRQLLRIVRRRRRREHSGVIAKPFVLLSPRERDVLRMLVEGKSYAAIGTALGISLGTVQTHIKSLYRKLDVSSKAEAVTAALRGGLA